MRSFRSVCVGVICLVVVLTDVSSSQIAGGRWSGGVRGGPNLWINSMNKKKIGLGGDLFLRYHLSRRFSLGLVGGYEELKAGQDPLYREIPNEYLKLRGFTASLVEWFYLSPDTKFSPYLYLGVGGVFYKRINGNGAYYPDDKMVATIHIPVGFGFEAFASPTLSFSFDVGFRVMDALTDNWRGNVLGQRELRNIPDAYATAKAGLNFYFGGTDSGSEDDDGDGLANGEELISKTDPKNPDTDGDGLKDGDEVKMYRTDPLNADTDGDRLSDGDEVLKYRTNPLKPDTEGDGVTDGDEVLSYKTDPLKGDTDGGGVDDGAEIGRGTNPLDPTDDMPKMERKEESVKEQKEEVKPVYEGPIESVNFGFGGARLDRRAIILLKSVLPKVNEKTDLKIEVIGHADSIGPDAYNDKLSVRRAMTVKRYLAGNGVPPNRIETTGKGEREPIAPNTTREGRAKNRRVEIHLKK